MSFGDDPAIRGNVVRKPVAETRPKRKAPSRDWDRGARVLRPEQGASSSSPVQIGGADDAPFLGADRVELVKRWLYPRGRQGECPARAHEVIWIEALMRVEDQVEGMVRSFVEHTTAVQELIQKAAIVKGNLQTQTKKCENEAYLANATIIDFKSDKPPSTVLENRLSGIDGALKILQSDSVAQECAEMAERLQKHVHERSNLALSAQGIALLKATDEYDEDLFELFVSTTVYFSAQCQALRAEMDALNSSWIKGEKILQSVISELTYAKKNGLNFATHWNFSWLRPSKNKSLGTEIPEDPREGLENPNFRQFAVSRVKAKKALPKGIQASLSAVSIVTTRAKSLIDTEIDADTNAYILFAGTIQTKQGMYDPSAPPTKDQGKANIEQLHAEYRKLYNAAHATEVNDDKQGPMTTYLQFRKEVDSLSQHTWSLSLHKSDAAVLEKMGLINQATFQQQYKTLRDHVMHTFPRLNGESEAKWEKHRKVKQAVHHAFSRYKMTLEWGYVPWDTTVIYHRWADGDMWEIYNDAVRENNEVVADDADDFVAVDGVE